MNDVVADRLWGFRHAFDQPVTVWLTAGVGGAIAIAAVVIALLGLSGRVGPSLRRELWQRTASWMMLAPALWFPVLAGAFWTVLALVVIAFWCYREYARATGLFREKLVSAMTSVAILAMYLAALDHWYDFFIALVPLGALAITVVSIPLDRPDGYVQRTGLAIFGFLLFGGALGHLAYATNDWAYRPVVLLVLVAVSLNDVFAFTIGKTLGGPKLLPRTSPNKTVSGSLGALVLTTLFVAAVAGPIFAGTRLADPVLRLGLGLLIAALGQLGDLMVSSVKRDIGIKDMGASIPGHGGLLDRFNSLLLVAPAVFHYVGYFTGFGLDQPTRILAEAAL